MAAAIALHNVSKTFDINRGKHASLKASILSFRRSRPQRLAALSNVSLSIDHGETVAIIGRNGSGKSTMMGIIGRVYKPSCGTVEVSGRMCTILDPGAGFHPELTGRENIFFNGAIMGLTTAQVAAKIDRIVEFSGVSEFIDSPVKTFSQGMLVRLGFAIAVETDPEILLIDEALAYGDAEFQSKCYQRIASFKDEGRTIILVTHDLEAARLVASRTIWLHKGEVRADGDTAGSIEAYLASLPHRD